MARQNKTKGTFFTSVLHRVYHIALHYFIKILIAKKFNNWKKNWISYLLKKFYKWIKKSIFIADMTSNRD